MKRYEFDARIVGIVDDNGTKKFFAYCMGDDNKWSRVLVTLGEAQDALTVVGLDLLDTAEMSAVSSG